MKYIKYLVIAVALLILGSMCVVSAGANNGKGEDKRMQALMRMKSRIIEKRGYDPSQWPPGLVELFMSQGLIR